MWKRLTPTVRHRLMFLVAGNLALLGLIFCRIQMDERAGFGDGLVRFGRVLADAGPNLAPIVLAGIGLTGIIMAGAIDLSIGAVVVVAGSVFGVLAFHGLHSLICFAACFLTALGLSSLNGVMIRWLKIPAIIVTLAGLTFYRGVALIFADLCIPHFSGSISVQDAAYHSPGKQYAGLILLTTLVITFLWESFGKTPRTWLAHGCSRDACRLHGLQPDAVLQSAFVIGGCFLGLAALTYATNRLTIDPARMALGFELGVIGAVVLGGTNIFGGEGSFVGTVLGAFFLYFADQSLLYVEIGAFYREAIQGSLIIGVIGFDCAIHRKQKLLDELR